MCSMINENKKNRNTHIGGLLIVINVVDISGQAKVSYFHHIVLSYQNIASSKISVNALNKKTKVALNTGCLNCDVRK